MLLRQNLGWREHHRAKPALDRPQRGAGGHRGFSRADIPLQQATHRKRPGHVAGDILPCPLLRPGQCESQSLDIRLHQPIVPGAVERLDRRSKPFSFFLNLNLEPDELLQSQAFPRHLRLLDVIREVHRLERLRKREPMTVVAGQPRFAFIDHLLRVSLHRAPHDCPQPSLLNALGQPVHRHNALEVNELLTLLRHLGLGMIHRTGFLGGNFAVDVNRVAGFVIAIHIRHVPPAAVKPR